MNDHELHDKLCQFQYRHTERGRSRHRIAQLRYLKTARGRRCQNRARAVWLASEKGRDSRKNISRRYALLHQSSIQTRRRALHRLHRMETLAQYGWRCVCCGAGHLEFLAVDHIGGRGAGAAHRRQIGAGSLYRWLKKEGYPQTGYRILCHNCNLAAGFYGSCPHLQTLSTPLIAAPHIDKH